MEIFKLTGRILVDANEANRSISKTDNNAKSLGTRLASGIKTAAKWGVALAAGAGVAVAGIKKLADTVAKTGDEIDKESQKMSVSAEQYQVLAFAAEHCGTSMTTLKTAMKKVTTSDFNGNIYDAINSLMQIEDQTERSKKAVEMFGAKAGTEMAVLLNSGTDGMAIYEQQLKSLGGIMSDEAVKAAAEYQDNLTDLRSAFGGLKNNLIGEFLPSINEVIKGLTGLMRGEDGSIDAVWKGLNDFGNEIKTVVVPVIKEAAGMIFDALFSEKNIENIVRGGMDMVYALVNGLLGSSNEDGTQSRAETAGKNLAKGIVSGVKKSFEDVDWWGLLWDIIKWQMGGHLAEKLVDAMNESGGSATVMGMSGYNKHASGLTYVPYDGYTATLHRGERVVSAGQNERYSDNSDVITAIEALGDRIASMRMLVDGEEVIGYVDDGLGRRATSAGHLSLE